MSDTSEDEVAIRQLVADAAAAESVGDVEAFVELLTADAIMLPQQSPTLAGTEAIRQFWQEIFDQISLDVTGVEVNELQVLGDRAYVRVSYRHVATSKIDKSSHPESGKSIWIANRQEDGAWRFSRVIWNTDA